MKRETSPYRLVFYTLFFLYLLTSSGKFDIIDGYFRYLLARKIAFEGSLSLEEDRISTYGEFTVRGKDGRFYSYFGLGQSLIMAIPLLLIGKDNLLIFILSPLFASLTSLLFLDLLLLLGFRRSFALICSILLGTGTILFPYSKSTFDTSIYTFFLLLTFLSCIKGSMKNDPIRFMISGFSGGYLLHLNPSGIIILPSILLLMILNIDGKNREIGFSKTILSKILPFFSGYLPLLLLFFWYNHYRFGDIFETGHTVNYTLEEHFANPLLIGLTGLLVSPGKGLFFYSPVLLFAIPGIIPLYRRWRSIALSIILLSFLFTLFHASLPFWHGDWCWGPRYLVPLTPLLFLPASLYLERVFGEWKGWTVKGLFPLFIVTISIIVQFAAVSLDHDIYFRSRNLEPYFHLRTLRPYFDPLMSPILDRFVQIVRVAKGMKDYRWIPTEDILEMDGDTNSNLLSLLMEYNNFDFFWVYAMISGRKKWATLAIAILILFNLGVASTLLVKKIKNSDR